MPNKLIVKTEILVRFNEADPLGIVWHGHYIRYFEDGREAFGEKYDIGYLDMHRENIVAPIVKINCDYKRILKYGQRIRIETTYHNTHAAKMNFSYNVYDVKTNEVAATGTSMQVFLQKDTMELMLTMPPFIVLWKQKWLAGV